MVGCGRAAFRHHLGILKRLPGVKLLAIADTTPDRVNHAARLFRIPHSCADVHELVRVPGIDVVAVAVPIQLHAEVAGTAVASGKHVYIEKPITLSLDDCDRLMKQVRQSSCQATTGFNMRWYRNVRRARAIVRSGAIGRPMLLESAFHTGTDFPGSTPEWRRQLEPHGGIFFERAVHHVDAWRFILDAEIESVYARTGQGAHRDLCALLTASLDNGTQAAGFFASHTSVGNEVHVYGDAGSVHVACHRFDGFALYGKGRPRPGTAADRLRRLGAFTGGLPRALWLASRGGEWNRSYETSWRHFLEAVRHDRTPDVTLEDGRQSLRVALAALESARTGAPVALSELTLHSPMG